MRRFDLFGPIHKAIRFALGQTLAEMGTSMLGEVASATRVVRQLEEVIQLCEDHRQLEDRFILPALTARLTGTLHAVKDAHAAQPRLVAELRALGETLVDTLPEHRALAGRTLYLHFSTFVAELLIHMAEEEQVVQPLLERLFTDDELREIQGRLVASMSGAERSRSARWMLPALNAAERAALVDSARPLGVTL